jgi:hypothetical protein
MVKVLTAREGQPLRFDAKAWRPWDRAIGPRACPETSTTAPNDLAFQVRPSRIGLELRDRQRGPPDRHRKEIPSINFNLPQPSTAFCRLLCKQAQCGCCFSAFSGFLGQHGGLRFRTFRLMSFGNVVQTSGLREPSATIFSCPFAPPLGFQPGQEWAGFHICCVPSTTRYSPLFALASSRGRNERTLIFVSCVARET